MSATLSAPVDTEGFGNSRRVGVAKTALVFILALNVLKLLLLLESGSNSWSSRPLIALGLAELGIALATAVAGISFLMWIHLTVRRAHAYGMLKQLTPGWAVGWWFIPFASLVMPYQMLAELTDRLEVRRQSLVGLWWSVYLAHFLLQPLARLQEMVALRSYGQPTLLWQGLVAMSGVVAAFLAFRLIDSVEEGFRQTESNAEAGSVAPVAKAAPGLMISLLAPLAAIPVFGLALYLFAGSSDEVAFLWVAADVAGYGVCAAAGLGGVVAALGLYRFASERRGGLALLVLGVLLPGLFGLPLMLHGITRVVEAIANVNPADAATIFAAGTSEAMTAPLFGALWTFALAVSLAPALLLTRLSRGVAKQVPYAVGAVALVALALPAVLSGMRLKGALTVFQAIANVNPVDKLTILVAGLEEMQGLETFAHGATGALALLLIALSALAYRSKRLRGVELVSVAAALVAAAFVDLLPSAAVALASSQTPTELLTRAPASPLQLVKVTSAPSSALASLEVGRESFSVEGSRFEPKTAAWQEDALDRIQRSLRQRAELHEAAGDASAPGAFGVALDAELKGRELQEVFALLAQAEVKRLVMIAEPAKQELPMRGGQLGRLAQLFDAQQTSGFPLELRAAPNGKHAAVAVGTVRAPTKAAVASIAEHAKSPGAQVAVLVGEDATTEQLVRLLAEASERGVELYVPVAAEQREPTR